MALLNKWDCGKAIGYIDVSRPAVTIHLLRPARTFAFAHWGFENLPLVYVWMLEPVLSLVEVKLENRLLSEQPEHRK
jgi:hypothetical protein